MKLLQNIVSLLTEATKDPVKGCELYKKEGCSHVDGILCDYPQCKMRKDYLNSNIPQKTINCYNYNLVNPLNIHLPNEFIIKGAQYCKNNSTISLTYLTDDNKELSSTIKLNKLT